MKHANFLFTPQRRFSWDMALLPFEDAAECFDDVEFVKPRSTHEIAIENMAYGWVRVGDYFKKAMDREKEAQ